MTAHTPWTAHRVSLISEERMEIWDTDCVTIAKVPIYHADPKGSILTATLIAAAPDLLDVCRNVADLLREELVKEPNRTIFWQAIAAVAKAEGR